MFSYRYFGRIRSSINVFHPSYAPCSVRGLSSQQGASPSFHIRLVDSKDEMKPFLHTSKWMNHFKLSSPNSSIRFVPFSIIHSHGNVNFMNQPIHHYHCQSYLRYANDPISSNPPQHQDNNSNTSQNQQHHPPPPPGPPGWAYYQFYAPNLPPYPPHQPNYYQYGMDYRAKPDAPVQVQLVSTRWNWINLFITTLILGVMAFIIIRSSGGGLSSLIDNKYKSSEDIPDLSFDDVKGNVEAKEELSDIVEYLGNPEKYRKLGIKVPKGVLLTGAPGTGKTLLAKAVAAESGVPFISTSGSEFEEMLVGVGARRVRQLFESAKAMAPCIIFIDEIDAIGGRREDFTSHQKMSLNQLLVEMDGFSSHSGIVVIGATNIPDTLDPALIRPGRFDRKVVVELPDPKARKDLLDHYLGQKTISPDVRTDILARAIAGFSGADIENMVNWAAIQAVKRKELLNMHTLEEAMLNVAMGRERKSLFLNQETRELCSFHESGHALVALKTGGAREIRRATLIPRGEALGMVNFLSKDGSPLTTQQELLAYMDTCMGGRAAEEIIYGSEKVTQGAGSDFQQATRIARAMVMQMGMSPILGPVYISDDNKERISTETLRLIEEEVARLLRDSMERAKELLQTNLDDLKNLSSALLKYETLDLDQIHAVLKNGELRDPEWDVLDCKEADRHVETRSKYHKRLPKATVSNNENPLTCSPTSNDLDQ